MIRSHFGVLAIAAMVGVSACGEDKKAQAPATLTIAIGSVAPLTGGRSLSPVPAAITMVCGR